MPRCLYCDEDRELTDDHVFPAAIGGRVFLASAVCAGCNNTFGHELEAVLANGFKQIRSLLNIPDREGNVPSLSATVQIQGIARPAVVKPSGQVVMHPYKTNEDVGEYKEIRYHFIPHENENVFQEKMQKRGVSGLEKSPSAELEVEAEVYSNYEFVASTAAHRSVAKIAFNGLALKCGCAFARSDAFARVREFVRYGTDATPVRLFSNQQVLNNFPVEPSRHWLILALDGQAKSAHSMIVLFGSLFYLVQLSSDYQGADVSVSFHYDAVAGKECSPLTKHVDTEISIVRGILGAGTIWDNIEESVQCLMHFVQQARPDVRIEREQPAE